MGGGGEAAEIGDLFQGQIRFQQILNDHLKPGADQQSVEGVPGLFLDDAADILLAEMDRVGELRQVGGLKILFQIL